MGGRVTNIALIAAFTILLVGCGGGATSVQNNDNSLANLNPNQAVHDNDDQINPLDPDQQDIIPPLIVPKDGPIDPSKVNVDVRANETHISFDNGAIQPQFVEAIRAGRYVLGAATFDNDEHLISVIIRNRRIDEYGLKASYTTNAATLHSAWVRIQIYDVVDDVVVQDFTIADQVIELAPMSPIAHQ